MKRTIATLGVVGLGVMGAAVSANAAPPDKITICHATRAAGNPFVAETINLKALKAHADDTLDIVPVNSGDIFPHGQNLSEANLALLANNCVPATVAVPPGDSGGGTGGDQGGTGGDQGGDTGGDQGGGTGGDQGGGTGGDQGGGTGGDQGGGTGGDQGGGAGGDQGGDSGGDQGGGTGGDQGGYQSGDQGGGAGEDQGGGTGGDQGGDQGGNQGDGTGGDQSGDSSGDQGGDSGTDTGAAQETSTVVTPPVVVRQPAAAPAPRQAGAGAPAATPAKVNVGYNVQTAVGHSPAPEGLPAWLLGLTGLFAAGSGAVLWRGGQRARKAAD